MTSDEPRRLYESNRAPAELRSLLQRAYEDALPSSTVDRLVHAAEGQAATLHRRPASSRCISWAKRTVRRSSRLLLAAAVLGAGGGAWYSTSGNSSASAPSNTGASIAQPASSIARPAVQMGATTAAAPPTVEPLTPSPPKAAVPARKPASLAPHPARRTRSPPSASETVAPASTTASVVAAPSNEPTLSPSYGEEFRLLRAARRALEQRPEHALALTDEHIRRFAHGMLAQEREAIAIEALVSLGKDAPAQARARAFFAAHPDSPHRNSVERALATPSARP